MIVSKHNMTRLYSSVIISLFDDIQLQRDSSIYTVPIVISSADHINHRNNDVQKNVHYSQNLPMISLSIGDISYNFQRQTNALLRKKYLQIDDTKVLVNWNDTSVDINFHLLLKSKTKTEMYQIVEHIMSYFKNGLIYVNVKSPLYDQKISTPIELITSSPEITLAEDYNDYRHIECQFDLVIKGIFHNHIDLDDNRNPNSEDYIRKLKLVMCHMDHLYDEEAKKWTHEPKDQIPYDS